MDGKLSFQVAVELAEDFTKLQQILSVIETIERRENSVEFRDLIVINNVIVNDVICAMSHVGLSFGVRLPVQLDLRFIPDMCHVNGNLLVGYIRDMKLFQEIERLAEDLMLKYHSISSFL